MKKARIGILGGAGVAAVNLLLRKLEEHYIYQGAKGDQQQPELILYSATQVPSRSLFLEGKGPSFVEDYIHIAKELERMGVTCIAIACNTAHFAIEEIREHISVPCIHLIDDVCTTIRRRQFKSIALLASEGCLKGNIYEQSFARLYPEVKIIYPNKKQQEKITKGIWNTKNIHRYDPIDAPERPYKLFSDVMLDISQEHDIDAFVFGCTDIAVDSKPSTPPPSYLSPLSYKCLKYP